jgi:hypothetical protein
MIQRVPNLMATKTIIIIIIKNIIIIINISIDHIKIIRKIKNLNLQVINKKQHHCQLNQSPIITFLQIPMIHNKLKLVGVANFIINKANNIISYQNKIRLQINSSSKRINKIRIKIININNSQATSNHSKPKIKFKEKKS